MDPSPFHDAQIREFACGVSKSRNLQALLSGHICVPVSSVSLVVPYRQQLLERIRGSLDFGASLPCHQWKTKAKARWVVWDNQKV